MGEIKLFGELSELISPLVQLELPDRLTKKDVLDALISAYPLQESTLSNCNVAVNQTYLFDEEIKSSDIIEIAIIPPVSGG